MPREGTAAYSAPKLPERRPTPADPAWKDLLDAKPPALAQVGREVQGMVREPVVLDVSDSEKTQKIDAVFGNLSSRPLGRPKYTERWSAVKANGANSKKNN